MECKTRGCSRPVYVKKRQLCRTCYAHWHRHGVEPTAPPLDKTQHISEPKAAKLLGCTPRKVAKMKERGELPMGKLTMRDVEAQRERWAIIRGSDAEQIRNAYDWLSTRCQSCGQQFHRKPTRAFGFHHKGKWIPPTRFCSAKCVKWWQSTGKTRQWICRRDGVVVRRSEASWVDYRPTRQWVVWPDGTTLTRAKAETRWALGKQQCIYCKQEFYPSTAHHRYCTPNCKRQHRAAAKRAKGLGATDVEVIGKLDVLRQDNWTCHLCGERIDAELQSPHPMAGTVDHLIPLSHGGTHTWDNLAAAHMRCNSIKGNRLDVVQVSRRPKSNTPAQNDAVPIMSLF